MKDLDKFLEKQKIDIIRLYQLEYNVVEPTLNFKLFKHFYIKLKLIYKLAYIAIIPLFVMGFVLTQDYIQKNIDNYNLNKFQNSYQALQKRFDMPLNSISDLETRLKLVEEVSTNFETLSDSDKKSNSVKLKNATIAKISIDKLYVLSYGQTVNVGNLKNYTQTAIEYDTKNILSRVIY